MPREQLKYSMLNKYQQRMKELERKLEIADEWFIGRKEDALYLEGEKRVFKIVAEMRDCFFLDIMYRDGAGEL